MPPQNQEPNLEEKLRELAEQANQVSDETIRQDLQRQIDELKAEFESQKQREPTYLHTKPSELDQLYSLETMLTVTVSITDEGNKYVTDLLLPLLEKLRLESLKIAKEKKYDAVLVDESSLSTKDVKCIPLGNEKRDGTHDSYKHTLNAIAYFYVMKTKQTPK